MTVIFPDAWEEETHLEQRPFFFPSFPSLKTPVHTSCKIFSLMPKQGIGLKKMLPLARRAPLMNWRYNQTLAGFHRPGDTYGNKEISKGYQG